MLYLDSMVVEMMWIKVMGAQALVTLGLSLVYGVYCEVREEIQNVPRR